MKKTRYVTYLALLTAASLCVFVLEAQLPPLTPVPGIKLGLANVFTLFAYAVLGAPGALALLLVRVVLGALVTGQVSAIGYSLSGGLLSYALLAALYRHFPARQLWVLSALCAIAHNVGQILLAAFVMGTHMIFWYLPVLVLAGMITGTFTGLACQVVLQRMRKGKFLSDQRKE